GGSIETTNAPKANKVRSDRSAVRIGYLRLCKTARRQGRDARLLGRLAENCPKRSTPGSGAYRSEARHIALSLVLRLRFTRSEQAIGCDMFWENMSNGLLAAPLGKSPEVGPRCRWTIWM